MRKIFIALFIVMLYANSNESVTIAQNKSHKTIPELTMPNPETASLGKYGNIPMDLYTGTANICVPLYTLDFDGLEIPINISYNTSGIRPSQEATWVGLGWTLSCEPVITRRINGICDITPPTNPIVGFAYTDVPLQEYGTEIDQRLYEKLELYSWPEDMRNGWDTEQDIFTANIFGENVSFILTQKALNNGVIGVKLINNKQYKIQYIESERSFIITNGEGFRFFFGQKEYSITAPYSNYGYQPTPPHTTPLLTGWKLNKIVSPIGKELKYTYSLSVIQGQPQFSNSKITTYCSYNPLPDTETVDYNRYSSLDGYHMYYLENIISDDINIEFKGSDRLDLGDNNNSTTIWNFLGSTPLYPKKLDNIVIKDASNNSVKNIKFNYSYFNEDQINSQYARQLLRLKLNQIDINGIPIAMFSYINPNQLPNKVYRVDDFWGFYNGDNHNTKSYPSYIRYGQCTPSNSETIIRVDGANRNPNFEYSKIGLLETITYPTKGYTKFNYETHSIRVNNFNSEQFRPYGLIDGKEIRSESSSVDYPVTSDVFEIKEDTNEDVVLNIAYGFGSNDYDAPPTASHIRYTIDYEDSKNISYQLINADNNTVIKQADFTSVALGPPANNNTNWNKLTDRIKLGKGRYKIVTKGLKHISNFYDEEERAYPGHPDYNKLYTVRVRVIANIPSLAFHKNMNMIVGGIRIKSVENYESDHTLLTKKEYKYILEDDSDSREGFVSSGILTDKLAFAEIKMAAFQHQYGGDDNDGENVDSQTLPICEVFSNSILKSPASNHIGYSRVEEIDTNSSGNKGRKVSEFINKPNEYNASVGRAGNIIIVKPIESQLYNIDRKVIVPTFSCHDANGSLLSETYYNKENVKIKESVYQYNWNYYDMPNFAHPNTISTNHAQYLYKAYERRPTYNNTIVRINTTYALQIHKIISENVKLISKTDTEFHNNIPISKTVKYEYNNEFLPKKITENTSISEKNIETEYKYPFDLLNIEQSSLMQKLVNENRWCYKKYADVIYLFSKL